MWRVVLCYSSVRRLVVWHEISTGVSNQQPGGPVSRLFRFSALPALFAVTSAVAGAQGSTVHFNLAGGLTLATSDFGDAFSTGYNLIAGIGINQRASALGFRAEGMYGEFSQQGGGDNARVAGVTANVLYNVLQPSTVQSNTLYLIGGIGYYSTTEPIGFFSSPSESNVGWNIGGGFKFPLSGFSAYVEARYHSVSTNDLNVTIIPISFGLIF
jgi:hypothetical protein